MNAVTTSLMTALYRVVDDPPLDVDPSTGKGPEWGKASPVGLLIILLLAIATFFLLRSMTRRLKRVQDGLQAPTAPTRELPDNGLPAAAADESPSATSQPSARSESGSSPG
jgi:hypothetical protein